MDPEIVAETWFALTPIVSINRAAAARFFGFNPKSQNFKLSLQHERLPQFFAPCDDKLKEGVRRVLTILASNRERDFTFFFDATVWAPGYHLCHGLEEKPVVLGGAHNPDPTLDRSSITYTRTLAEGNFVGLPQEDLAKQAMSYMIGDIYRRSVSFDVCFLPRHSERPGKAQDMLQETGRILDKIVEVNGKPPIATSFDGAGEHALVLRALLGLGPDLSEIPFYCDLFFESMSDLIRCFPYKMCYHNGGKQEKGARNAFFVALDPKHVLKRIFAHVASPAHAIQLGQVEVFMAYLLRGGCPVKAWEFTDQQSDKARASASSMHHVPEDIPWDAYGHVLLCAAVYTMFSGWISPELYNREERLANALSGYYFLLICWCRIQDRGEARWGWGYVQELTK